MTTPPPSHVRPAVARDTDAIVDAVLASGLFGADDIGVAVTLLIEHFAQPASDHVCLVPGNADAVDGVAYAQPTPAADRVWYLTMIAARPDAQRSGAGTALLRAVETELTARGQRLLLIETSALPDYESARRFYARAGYDEEARVRDFHEDGDDMVLFWKRLTPPSVPSA
ncbi:GNAT family N-acetyltransferase [Mycolicibacterium rufum]|uniref:GNAT family N-acetyltransferase n=1 Tax=Mycolicibacterium rufum TaxID=318424 RepID=A0A9X2XT19_9MYCO|nr:GNAT family N-acetyltransferase [Mycolicibacterium rufum]KGI68531.1 hypothetical protein EU78_15100 [Mycolicibacterium rufum]MCV7069631.1 GNAT family N-acetyltransferase [Mycolicibacterium rufum]ULP34663.1 GNAT family N-acetyltransferase [Mycolicibacterium rufum]